VLRLEPEASLQITTHFDTGRVLIMDVTTVVATGWSVALFVHLLVSLNNILIFYVACLGVHNVGVGVLASGEGVSEDDRTLLNCLEHVSYAKIFIWLAVLSWCFVFP
jgi:hypothetical protein